MGFLYRAENKLSDRFQKFMAGWSHAAVWSLSDYYLRELDHEAAAVSFYAIFSIFPLMAFLVFAVAELTGSSSSEETAAVVLSILKQLVPTMDGWVEQGVLDVLRMNTVTNWINAGLLAWSGMRLFSALLTAISSVPSSGSLRPRIETRSKVTRTLLASITLILSSVLLITLVICDFLARSDKIPPWLQSLPYAYQDLIYWSGRSGILLSFVSVVTIASLFKLLLPCRLSLRSALSGAVFCSLLLVLSRSLYWIYLHYQASSIQSSYGAFSALILNMLWIHFVINCILYCCLFALHLDDSHALQAGASLTEHKPGSKKKEKLGNAAAIALVTLLSVRSARADGWDESAYLATRWLPRGIALGATLGYGQTLWGENIPGKLLFGYVRPSSTLSTSILLNRAELGVDIFPISFFGIRTGLMGSQRSVDPDTLDCSTAACRGLLGTYYVQPRLLMGYGPISVLASVRVAWYSPSSTTLPYFGEDVSSLTGSSTGDHTFSGELAAQYRIAPEVSVGAYLATDHMVNTGSTNNLISVFAKLARGQFSYTLGAGAYESTTQPRGFTCFGVVSWTRLPSIGLR